MMEVHVAGEADIVEPEPASSSSSWP